MKNLIILLMIGSLYIGCATKEVIPEPSQPKKPIESKEPVEPKEPIEPVESVKPEMPVIPEIPDVTVPEIPKQEELPQKVDEDKDDKEQ